MAEVPGSESTEVVKAPKSVPVEAEKTAGKKEKKVEKNADTALAKTDKSSDKTDKADKADKKKDKKDKKKSGKKSFIGRHKVLFIILLIIIIILLIVFFKFQQKKKQMEAMMNQVTETTETVSKQDIRNTIAINGSIASNNSKSITTNVSNATIESVNVEVGDYVNEGDVIMTLDSDTIEKNLSNTEEELSVSNSKASMNITSAQRNLTDAKTQQSVDATRNAQTVSDASDAYDKAVAKDNAAYDEYEKYSAAATADKAEAAELKKKVDAAETEFNSAVATFKTYLDSNSEYYIIPRDIETYTDLDNLLNYATDSNLKTQLDQQLAPVRTAQEKYNEAESAYEAKLSEAEQAQKNADTYYSQHQTYETEVTKAESTYDTAVQNQEDTARKDAKSVAESADSVTSAKLDASTTGNNAELQIDSYEEQLEGCTVTAPFTGVITSLSVNEGDTYTGGEICVIQDYTDLIVDLAVDEYDIPDIEKDMNVAIKTDATGDDELTGVVTFVAPTPTAGDSVTYEVKISITNPSERLRIGMTAKTSIITSEADDVLAVPYDSVKTNPDGTKYVTVKDGEDKRDVTIETGIENDYYVEVTGGDLKEGDEVVLENSVSAGSSDQNADMMMMGGGMGGGNMGGGGAPGGGGMGGGPGGN